MEEYSTFLILSLERKVTNLAQMLEFMEGLFIALTASLSILTIVCILIIIVTMEEPYMVIPIHRFKYIEVLSEEMALSTKVEFYMLLITLI